MTRRLATCGRKDVNRRHDIRYLQAEELERQGIALAHVGQMRVASRIAYALQFYGHFKFAEHVRNSINGRT